MKIAEIENRWQAIFGFATPVAHIFKEQRSECWLRIHSLPESTRYADNSNEYEILLSRHNEIATGVLGAQSRCILFIGQYVENSASKIYLPEIFPLKPNDFQDFTCTQDEDMFFKIWLRLVDWSPGEFDDVIRQVADDEMRFLLFFSLETENAYAPYDGGADLFFGHISEMHGFKQRYVNWLSKHPTGN